MRLLAVLGAVVWTTAWLIALWLWMLTPGRLCWTHAGLPRLELGALDGVRVGLAEGGVEVPLLAAGVRVARVQVSLLLLLLSAQCLQVSAASILKNLVSARLLDPVTRCPRHPLRLRRTYSTRNCRVVLRGLRLPHLTVSCHLGWEGLAFLSVLTPGLISRSLRWRTPPVWWLPPPT